jgi:hypothetical protein
MNLKQFFQWLTLQPGYKSRLKYSDAEYFNLSGKDARVATARREQCAPSQSSFDRLPLFLRGLLPDGSMLMGAIVIVDKLPLHSLTPGHRFGPGQ